MRVMKILKWTCLLVTGGLLLVTLINPLATVFLYGAIVNKLTPAVSQPLLSGTTRIHLSREKYNWKGADIEDAATLQKIEAALNRELAKPWEWHNGFIPSGCEFRMDIYAGQTQIARYTLTGQTLLGKDRFLRIGDNAKVLYAHLPVKASGASHCQEAMQYGA